jgi:hypothetical protein
MSDETPNNGNLINFIAATVESVRDQVEFMRDQMVTKTDLENFATKEDVTSLRGDVTSLRGDVTSLREETNFIGGQVETMRDQMATKSDIARLEDRLRVETAAVRGDIEQVQLRLDSIDKTLRARLDEMEGEIARLRSVVYLLAKDRPELLRLLGQPPSSGGTNP